MKNRPNFRSTRINDLVFASVLLLAMMTACTRDQPPQTVVVQQPAPAAAAPAQVAMVQPDVVQVQPDVVMQDDYVYYPQYEVYYSSSRHQYGYRNGNAWDWRPAPPSVAVNVLLGSPSVHMDFHDSPALHHDAVVRSYPRNWAPAGAHHDEHPDDRKDRH